MPDNLPPVNTATDKMGIEIASQQQDLKSTKADHPDGGCASENGKDCAADHRLNAEDKERTEEYGQYRKSLFHRLVNPKA